MEQNYNISPFLELGHVLRARLADGSMDQVIAASCDENPWFTKESVTDAIEAICSQMLTTEKLSGWLDRYGNITLTPGKRVGVIMAGNIPLVGFLDMLSVLVCRGVCIIKPSSKDNVLIRYVAELILGIDPSAGIEYLDDNSVPDAVIATGGDLASNYFHRRYGNIPTIIRGNRTSVAILDGKESADMLNGLHEDIFKYCGLGCRNVSHLFLPRGYDVKALCRRLSAKPIDNQSYLNEYRQNKALYSMLGREFIDGGFFTFSEGSQWSDKLSNIVYTFYDSRTEADRWIEANDPHIQCVVASESSHPRHVVPGMAQYPGPGDYPDGIDIINFLLSLK